MSTAFPKPANRLRVLGLMSGTSLDGLDLCLADYWQEAGNWQFEFIKTQTRPYPEEWAEKLRSAIQLPAPDLLELHSAYGFYLGEACTDFLEGQPVDLIASHGHTTHHQPARGFTSQIGDGRAIALVTNCPVVWDFRSQDVLMGGQGAPLVPIGDRLLFSAYDACVNMGGFSNISFEKEGKRIAFDICPVNILLNPLAQTLGQPYDQGGKLARKGKVLEEMLSPLESLDYYKRKGPKSLGAEDLKAFYPESPARPEDLLATFTRHAALRISSVIKEHRLRRVLFTGGGAYNTYLLEQVRSLCEAEVVVPENELVEFKEALVFGLMGALRYQNQINVLASATGAARDHSSGLISK